jgi:hypothetical protein
MVLMHTFPGRGAAQKRVYARERAIAGALQIRDRFIFGVCEGPGSAAHHFVLRCARDTRVLNASMTTKNSIPKGEA